MNIPKKKTTGKFFIIITVLILVTLACGQTSTPESPGDVAVVEEVPPEEIIPPAGDESEPPPAIQPTSPPAIQPTSPPAIQPTATQAPIGFSRANPYPSGDLVSAPNWDVQVTEVKRGDAAWQDIQAANMFNEPPSEGHEYLLVKIRAKSTYADDEEHFISDCDFGVTGDMAIKYTCYMASIVEPEPSLSATLFSGGETEGWAGYLIAENEGNLILIFDETWNYESDAIRYIAIDEGASIQVPPELAAIPPTDIGTQRSAPAQANQTITTEDWEVTILESVRGEEAWVMVQETNQFNDPPAEGYEYIAVKVHVHYIGTDDAAVSIDGFYFKTTGSAAVLYDTPSVVDPLPNLDAYLYPGGEYEGWVVLQAGVGETGVMVVFEPWLDFSGAGKRYIALD